VVLYLLEATRYKISDPAGAKEAATKKARRPQLIPNRIIRLKFILQGYATLLRDCVHIDTSNSFE